MKLACLLLLIPLVAAADSQEKTDAANAAVRVAAHVNFKIIIPPVLYLSVADEGARGAGGRAAVGGNSRTMTLSASGSPSAGGTHGPALLSIAGKTVVARDTACLESARLRAQPDGGDGHPLICTASIP